MSAPVYVPRHSKRAPRLPLRTLPSYRRDLFGWSTAYAAMIVLAAGYAWVANHV